MANVRTLSDIELQELFNFVGEIMTLNSLSHNLPGECRESRFSMGQIQLCGKQRYKCKDCEKTFNDFTKSSLSNTKLPLEKWIKYAKCMVLGYSIRKCAKNVDLCVKTSFYMRHKILDAVRIFMGTGNVEGVVEMDETFIAESFKWHNMNGIYHINSLHSKFRKWMYRFHGVSTKFLANYLYWFKWLEFFNEDKEIVKSKNMLVHSTVEFVDTKIENFKGIIPIFV